VTMEALQALAVCFSAWQTAPTVARVREQTRYSSRQP
jgi:hypothetical protein